MMKKVASKVDENGVEFGWRSTIEGITSDTADKLRGNRVENIYFEESGNNKCLIDTYERGRALVNILGKRVGNMFVFGTSGEQGPQLEGIKKMFYNPSGYRILPFFNKSMASGEPLLTGYFIPSYSMWFGDDEGNIGYDSRGVVYEDLAKEHYLKEWARIEDPKALMINKAEYCFTPEDAFILEGENRFDREKLADQLAQIEIHKTVDKPTNCKLRWPMKGDLVDRSAKPFVKFESDGKIQLVEEPITNETGIPFPNLYCAGIDAIDSDASTSTGQDDVSEFCMVVMRRLFGLQPPKVVAIYKDRPANVKEAFDTALKLCQYYNCKALVEATRISIKQYFEHCNALNYLMHRPRATANTSARTNFKQYGVPATQAIIEHQLDLIEQYISDYCDIIQFPNMLDELLRYSYANKRKFDIVAAFGICLLADEEMIGKTIKTEPVLKKLLDVGYYRDQYGRMQFGIIKKEEISTMRYGWNKTSNY